MRILNIKGYSVFLFLLTNVFVFSGGCQSVVSPDSDTDTSEYDKCGRDETQPWTGCWYETQQILCDTNEKIDSKYPVYEFILHKDGRFYVNWGLTPSSRDYEGLYHVDKNKGTIELFVIKSNIMPDGFDGIGTYEVNSDKSLICQDIYLGPGTISSDDSGDDNLCGQIFYNALSLSQ